MPATRKSRSSTGPAARGTQKTLPFNNSRITKATSSSKPVKSASSLTPPPTKPVDIDVGHVSSAVVVQEQAKVELASVKGEGERERTEEEVRASKVTDAQVKRYWKEKEGERLAKRVHQEGLSVEEKVLRLWDMSSQYGPCIGIARMKRWVRANKLGLSPPIEVLAVLLKEEEKGHSGIERAYVDELMSSKQIES